jgi:acetyl esterase
MPLDAQSEEILAARRKAGMRGVAGQTEAEVRASRDAWRAHSEGARVEVHATVDLQAAGPYGAIPIRLYRPDAGDGRAMAIFFHGGGWVIGDLDHSDALCRWLCRESGCIVANVDYRLAPEHKYPAAAEDAYAALVWLHANAAANCADAGRLAVVGSSAGGNLAAVAALMARDRGGPRLCAQVLVYPVTDQGCDSPSYVEFADGYVVSSEDMRWYWRQYLADPSQANDAYASPLRARELCGLPPALVITAEYDCVRDDGERYAERLRAAGVEARVSRYRGTLHGFFAMPGVNDQGTRAVAEAAAYLRHVFGPGTPS